MDTNSVTYKIGKKYKIFKGFINNLQAQWFENAKIQKVKTFFNNYPNVKRVATLGAFTVAGFAFKEAMGANIPLFSPDVAYADDIKAEPLTNTNVELTVAESTPVVENNVNSQVETNDASVVSVEDDTTKDITQSDNIQTTSDTNENAVKEETTKSEVVTNSSTDDTEKKAEQTTKENNNINYDEVEKKNSEESKNGDYLKPTYAVDGVDISENTDQGKSVFDASKTNCIVFTDSNGNTKIWTLDSYGNASHGVASNQETLINNLKNSELTNLNKDGTHELVWPGFDYTDTNGISHCSFDGGEITFDPNTNEYTVTYDKGKYASTMGVETSTKYELNPDENRTEKPTETSTPTPEPDNPETPKQEEPTKDDPIIPEEKEETSLPKTGDGLDVETVAKAAGAVAVGGAGVLAGHKLMANAKEETLEDLKVLKEMLMSTMGEDMAEDMVINYANKGITK